MSTLPRRALVKGRALCAVSLANMLEYRAEIYLWVLASVLPLILLGVWSRAAQSGAFPLSSVQFIRYFICVFVVRQFTFIWVIWEFEELVVSGNQSASGADVQGRKQRWFASLRSPSSLPQ